MGRARKIGHTRHQMACVCMCFDLPSCSGDTIIRRLAEVFQPESVVFLVGQGGRVSE